MRYLVFLGLCAVTLPVFGYNEAVSAISYNPSRSGNYTHLKVVKTATLKGGMQVAEPVSVRKTITIKDEKHNDCSQSDLSKCDQIANVKPIVAYAQCADNSTFCSWNDFSSSVSGGQLQGNQSSSNTYQGLTITMKGGTLSSSNTSDTSTERDYVHQITKDNNSWDLEVNSNTVQVTGNVITNNLGGVAVNPIPSQGYTLGRIIDDDSKAYRVVGYGNSSN